ncbi:unnamed protein product [Sympodiomycopsis kandeliae]
MRLNATALRSFTSSLPRNVSSARTIQTLARPAASSSLRAIPPPASCCPSYVRYKSKRSKASFASNVDEPSAGQGEEDVPVMNTKGKGSKSNATKGAKSKRGNREQAEVEDDRTYSTSTKNDELPGERYDEKALTSNMNRAVERCKSTVTQMVGMHGRADPALLDSVKLAYPGDDETLYPLRDFASVGTRDGSLLVTLYDKDMMKHVERAIYMAELNLVPQQVGSSDEGVLRIPIPRPTTETRLQLLKDINRICENAKISIRSARHIGQKQIKADIDNKIIGATEGQKEQKTMDESVKKFQKEIEELYNGFKKKIESQRDE